jgi:LysM repeat protein
VHRARGASVANAGTAASKDALTAKDSVVMRTRRIVRGDSLSGIAVEYGTSVQALAAANGMRPEDIIRTGQELVIPQAARPGGGNEWLRYARTPEQAGRLDLMTYRTRYRGRVIEKGRITPEGRRALSALLGAESPHPPLPDRLIRLFVRVSDTFGGRPIRLVSGYRTTSFFSDSKHKHSSAIDFSIAGVPNAVVREYLLLFDDVGVGYYPNSSFVHFDVRDGAMQWVDYAGPGEAPRLHPNSPRYAHAPRYGGRSPSVADLDEIAERVVAEMGESKKRSEHVATPENATPPSRAEEPDAPEPAPQPSGTEPAEPLHLLPNARGDSTDSHEMAVAARATHRQALAEHDSERPTAQTTEP